MATGPLLQHNAPWPQRHGYRGDRYPDNIDYLQGVQFVSLANNSLVEVSARSGIALAYCQELHLQHNQITELPVSFKNLDRCEYLDISHNYMKAIPEEIGDMESLVVLDLRNNLLSTLPLSLAEIPALEQLFLQATNMS